ncbi:MAG: bifunctional aspartate kinase/homoserine dehydrogenase I [Bacteroidia bacterium]
MKVLKFGGSSVATPERIRNVATICCEYARRGESFAVVVSAMGGMTDRLIEMSKVAASGSLAYKDSLAYFSAQHTQVVHELIKEDVRHPDVLQEIIEGQEELGNLLYGLYLTRDLTPRTLDYIQSFGERASAFLLAQVITSMGVPARYVNARQIITTDDSYGAAKVLKEQTYQQIRDHFARYPEEISVITGFIAATRDGITTTLGRGGSDYTASIIGAAVFAAEIEIWTDVDGVMTADPRKVKQAFPVASMSYQEALEMSHFGAKVIYPPTVIPALEQKIPLRIKNSFRPEVAGTLISDQPDPYPSPVKGIASINDVSLITLEGSGIFGASSVAARLFAVLARDNINAILITQGSSEHAICFAIRPQDAAKASQSIGQEFSLEIRAGLIEPLRVVHKLAIIAAIGDNMKSQPGISGKLFQALGKNGVNVIVTAQGSSERNISVVIRQEDEAKALTAVHDVFFLSNYYTLNLFIVGAGLVGGTLLRQIKEHAQYLMQEQYVEIRVVALTNTRKMLFAPEGISLDTWKEQLEASSEIANLPAFVQRMLAMNLPNSVFIDNTAGEAAIEFYPDILRSAISISTPNKVAVSRRFADYKHLKQLADQYSVKFFYETNVGAGLPLLTTLNDLINSGDRILRIEGVLSGSLSFIFNSYTAGRRFSEIVQEARTRGYTEPDPRIDLSGKDVARKLLILARESRLPMEPEDIRVENILPQSCMDAEGVEAFMAALSACNGHFEALRASAEREGKVLRFIATLEGSQAYISLQSLGPDSPFYQLSGSDNMVVFTSLRYQDRPLVIKGPGAGAEVTAAGIFAEILRIGYYLS